MTIAIVTTKDENVISLSEEIDPFVVSLSNHERPFDKLRANGGKAHFRTDDTGNRLSCVPLCERGDTDGCRAWVGTGFKPARCSQTVCPVTRDSG